MPISSEEDKALARRFFELMEQRGDGNLTQMKELFAPDFVVHVAGQPSMDLESFEGLA